MRTSLNTVGCDVLESRNNLFFRNISDIFRHKQPNYSAKTIEKYEKMYQEKNADPEN